MEKSHDRTWIVFERPKVHVTQQTKTKTVVVQQRDFGVNAAHKQSIIVLQSCLMIDIHDGTLCIIALHVILRAVHHTSQLQACRNIRRTVSLKSTTPCNTSTSPSHCFSTFFNRSIRVVKPVLLRSPCRGAEAK